MPLTWNEIKTRAAAFVHEWRDEEREHAEAKTFWDQFLNVFGVNRRRVATFEEAVKKAGGGQGFIDLFWPGVMLAEHKSRGKDLDKAYGQALDYFPNLADDDLPRYVVVSDFERMRLHDLDTGEENEFAVADLLDHVSLFGFVAGYEKRSYAEQDPVNVKAARQMAALHDALEAAGYRGHDLERMLVRLLFCLFADDTGIFSPRGAFQDFVETRTRTDGGDLGPMLGALFQTLDTPLDERQSNLDETLAAFPYVNGALFSGPAPHGRVRLRDAGPTPGGVRAGLGRDQPGHLREPVPGGDGPGGAAGARGALHLGDEHPQAHRPAVPGRTPRRPGPGGRRTGRRWAASHDRLAAFRLLDPACGCGNFLVVAYRELRRLEMETIRRMQGGQRVLDIAALVRVDVDQCFGIEVEDFPAEIARTALWLVDHQMNLEVAEVFGEYFTRLPLTSTPHVLHGNALTTDWGAAWGEAQPEAFDVILGNPPFGGKKEQKPHQKKDLRGVLHGIQGAGVLDFVIAGWFVKAARYMNEHPQTRTAFVATNSISQGEQVGILWNELIGEYGCHVHFAHRTFRWDNEASGKAAVHVVIEGFGPQEVSSKRLFDYDDVRGEPTERTVSNVNPYLVEAPDVVVLKRSRPLLDVPQIREGSALIDWGHFVMDDAEAEAVRAACPQAGEWIRPFFNGEDLINGIQRWCLWLMGADPRALRSCAPVRERVEAVREKRAGSSRAATNRLAATPSLFGEIRQPTRRYLFIPKTSSENRTYIPMAFLPPEVILNNTSLYIDGATLYEFGVLTSAMHMAWFKYTGGRMKSDYRYSNTVVYNNFPWPESLIDKQRQSVEAAARSVLDIRQPHLDNGATLADLYDPLAMPPELVRAHRALDRAVDLAYRPQPFTTEANRVAFLFDRYEALANPLAVG